MKKLKLEIMVSDIEVDERYYNFKYVITINGEKQKGECNSDHSWSNDVKGFKKLLEEGYACQLALEQIDFD